MLVQAAPTAAESDYLLSIAERTSWMRGVVGWVDFDAPDVEQQIAKRAAAVEVCRRAADASGHRRC